LIGLLLIGWLVGWLVGLAGSVATEYISALKEENDALRQQLERQNEKMRAYETLTGIRIADRHDLHDTDETLEYDGQPALRCIATGRPYPLDTDALAEPEAEPVLVVPSLQFDIQNKPADGYMSYFPIAVDDKLQDSLSEELLADIDVETLGVPIFITKLIQAINRNNYEYYDDNDDYDQDNNGDHNHNGDDSASLDQC
jgi:hypothetical protein